jgi:hypothetical protein
MLKKLCILFLVFLPLFLFAQDKLNVQEPSYIKSITLHANRVNTFEPIIKLGESLVFSFDDLEGDEKDYTYKIEHCTYDWKKSNIPSTVYINGFSEDNLRHYENSFNTYQNYTHYSLQIPNDNIRIKISGNYLLSVLNEDEDVVFTRKFIVYQPKVDVGVSIHKSKKVAHINTKQNVEFVINHPNLLINNPSEEIKVAVYQNNDWNTLVTDLKPQFYKGTQLIYKYGDATNFWAGNEFLFFDSKDVRNATNNIRRVVLKDLYETRLYVDGSRINKQYTYYPDINGSFFIRSINVEDTKLEADYTKIHFALESYEEIGNDDIYVYGAFNDWQLTDENRMYYNDNTKLYETNLILKQGFYNYTYITVDQGSIIDTTFEGSHYQTENIYAVLVYYHKFGSRYDEVIGYGSGSSINLQN